MAKGSEYDGLEILGTIMVGAGTSFWWSWEIGLIAAGGMMWAQVCVIEPFWAFVFSERYRK